MFKPVKVKKKKKKSQSRQQHFSNVIIFKIYLNKIPFIKYNNNIKKLINDQRKE